jgi:nucleoside-diphosphate-sugar epimerase
MAVVVTGAAGFIGRHLVRLLTARGERVVGIDRRPVPADAGVVPLVADLAGAPDHAVEGALREADAVFHLAGRAGVRGDGDPPEALDRLRRRDNVLATERVLACVGADVPLVVTSSSSVYGGARRHGRRPSRETDPLRPAGGYARSKLVMEDRCAQRIARGGLVALARPFTVAGEGQRPDMAISRWLEAVRRGDPVRVLGSPERRRDVTDVADVAEGLARAAERGVCGPVNLGTGVGHTLRALIATVGAALGAEPETVVLPALPEEPPATLAHTATCRRRLGFVPRTDLQALVRRQAAAAGLLPAAAPRDSAALLP